MSEAPAGDSTGGGARPGGPSNEGGGWVGWLEHRLNLTEIFSFLSHFGLVYTPVDNTRPVREVVREVARMPVPAYTRGPRLLGLLTVILFGLEVVTGVLLTYYYRPTPEAAFASTRDIVRDLPLGWLVHQLHAWGAWLLAMIVVVRLLRFFWDGLYRAPREVLWWSAVAMAWLVLQSDFTGKLLTWDSHAYWSAVRGMEVVFALPVVGSMLAFLLGGQVINENVLLRFYVLHLLVLPTAFAVFLYLTFATLRRVGLSPVTESRARGATTFREHLYGMAILTALMLGVLATLAVMVPFRFGTAADPYSTPAGARPPWYMLAPYAIIQFAPGPTWLLGLALLAVAFGVLLLPLWAPRDTASRSMGRARIVGIAVLAVWAGLSILGAILERR
ncbi:MAG TPA: cytochrome b N-terminal domain-containing protein [Candidatus Eisenbacteria bacterium]|nr:cytochrome b N-terminal domain-containing protein [Candidatus Eisenbacteria bacterium]